MRDSIKKAWLWAIEVYNTVKPQDQDEEARRVIRKELSYLYSRTQRLEKLLSEPERLRLARIAEMEADVLQRILHEKRRNPEQLTVDEQLERDHWRNNLTKRENCRHLKGAMVSRWGVDKYGGPKGWTGHKDYSVGMHTFINCKTRIWCLNGCGFESWNGDEKWELAKLMADNSSNHQSSSEIAPMGYGK